MFAGSKRAAIRPSLILTSSVRWQPFWAQVRVGRLEAVGASARGR